MATPELSLKYRVQLPSKPAEAGDAPPLLLLLHGFGSNEGDVFGLAPAMDGRFVVVAPRAPLTRAPGSYAWFPVAFTAHGPDHDAATAARSLDMLVRFIGEATAAFGADARRVFLCGFSQGAIMSASVLLQHPALIAGAVLMSGRILPEVAAHPAPLDALAGKPVLLVHGTTDAVLPIHHGRESRAVLAALPVALTYREYEGMPHTITDESLADVTAWLSARLNEPAHSGQASA